MVNNGSNTARNSIDNQMNSSGEEQKVWYLGADGTLKDESVSRQNDKQVSLNSKIKEGDTLYLDTETSKISRTPTENSQLIENFEEIAENLYTIQQEQFKENLDQEKEEQRQDQDVKIEDLKKLLEDPDKFAVGNKITYTNKKGEVVDAEIIEPITGIAEGNISIKTDNNQNGFAVSKEKLETDKNFKVITFAKNQDSVDLNKETIQQIVEHREKLQKENTTTHKELIAAKKMKATERIKNLYQIIKKLEKEKSILRNKYENTLQYDGEPIDTLDTKLISFQLMQKRNVNGRIERTLGGISTIKNLRSRKRLNKTIRKLNDIKDDPKRGVKYIMSKSRKRGGGKIGARIKRGYNSLTIRDVDRFDKIFNEQKKFFIEDLESKIKTNYSTEAEYLASDDGKRIQAIKNRLDYYQDAYKRKMITV